MSDGSLKAGKSNQYFAGEVGWTDMLEEVVPDTNSESWRLVASSAVKAYIDSQLHEVWHSHGSVDYLVPTISERNKLPDTATSCIVTDNDKVYVKKNGNWVEAEEQADDFAVYHVNYEWGTIKAGSAWYFFQGSWNNLDADLTELEKRVEKFEDIPNFVTGEAGTKIQIVGVDFDLADAEDDVIYLVAQEVQPEPTYHTVRFDTKGGTTVFEQIVADGAMAQRPTLLPEKTECVFDGWFDSEFDPPEPSCDDVRFVRFDADGGQPTPATQAVREGGRAKKPAVDPTKRSWEASGWYDPEDGEPLCDSMRTVIFDTDGGTPVPEPLVVQMGSLITEPPVPHKGNLWPMGWYDADEEEPECEE